MRRSPGGRLGLLRRAAPVLLLTLGIAAWLEASATSPPGPPRPAQVGAAVLGLLAHEGFRSAVAEVVLRGLLGGGLLAALGWPLVLAWALASAPPPVRSRRPRPTLAAALWAGMERMILLVSFLVLAHKSSPLHVAPVALPVGFALRSAAGAARSCPPALLAALAAQGLGRFQVLVRVLLPWTAPAALHGFRLGFTWVLGIALGAGLHALMGGGTAPYQNPGTMEPAWFLATVLLFLGLTFLWNAAWLALLRRLAPWEGPLSPR